MPRLLAAERQAALRDLLHHVLVADRTADELDAEAAQRNLEADVAHDRRHDRVAAQAAFRLQLPRADQQDRVAVDDPAPVIDEDRAIAVAVERHAQPVARRDTTASTRRSGCVEPQSRLMLRPSGSQPSHVTSNPSSPNSARRHGRRRAVGAVDRRCGPARAAEGSGRRRQHVIEVLRQAVDFLDRAGARAGQRPGPVGHERLHLRLERARRTSRRRPRTP